MQQILTGFILALIISGLAYVLRALDLSGVLAAVLLGTVVFGLGGLEWALLLLAFFVSSSGLSRLAKSRKLNLAEKFSKGSRRDAGQVLANGGIAGLAVILHAIFPWASWPWMAFAGALAAANADTWATELGVLSPSLPRLLTSGKAVERGTSGAISLAGLLAAFGGAGLIAVLAIVLRPGWPLIPLNDGGITLLAKLPLLLRLVAVTSAGLVGSLMDSFLGAKIQAIYYCPVCQKETERHPIHTCGAQTQRRRGLPWLNNEWVNVACTLAGAFLAVAFDFFIH